MTTLQTQITPTSPEYAANAKAMRSLVSELQSLLAGIELEKQTRLALTEALQQSGHLINAIKSSTASTN